ncbi:hypothetical protein CSPAE12_01910 [Colletotrichum incanum]|nr:hypothetical protein CSPAE12_01910 [Colletotrichum incanum]
MATFPLFSKLPFELRIRIWQLAREPRTLTVRASTELNKHRRHPLDYTLHYYTSPTPLPAVLQTCRESRNLGLYERSFTGGLTPRYIWVNFELDKIQATYWDLKLVDIEKEIICHLSIEFEDLECLSRHYRQAVAGIRVLKTMEFLSQGPVREWAYLIGWIRDIIRAFSGQAEYQFSNITVVEKATGRTVSLAHYNHLLEEGAGDMERDVPLYLDHVASVVDCSMEHDTLVEN